MLITLIFLMLKSMVASSKIIVKIIISSRETRSQTMVDIGKLKLMNS